MIAIGIRMHFLLFFMESKQFSTQLSQGRKPNVSNYWLVSSNTKKWLKQIWAMMHSCICIIFTSLYFEVFYSYFPVSLSNHCLFSSPFQIHLCKPNWKSPLIRKKKIKYLTNQLLTIRLQYHAFKIKLEEGKGKPLTIHEVGSKSNWQKINFSSIEAMKVVLIYIAADVAPGCNLSSCSISVLPHGQCNREDK